MANLNITLEGFVPVEYSIDLGVTWEPYADLATLPDGTYIVWLKDASDNVQVIGEVVIETPSGNLQFLSVNYTNCSEKDISDGTIDILATNGVEPYQYSIDNGSNYQLSGSFINLSVGTYRLKCKDANNDETGNVTIFITEPIFEYPIVCKDIDGEVVNEILIDGEIIICQQ